MSAVHVCLSVYDSWWVSFFDPPCFSQRAPQLTQQVFKRSGFSLGPYMESWQEMLQVSSKIMQDDTPDVLIRGGIERCSSVPLFRIQLL